MKIHCVVLVCIVTGIMSGDLIAYNGETDRTELGIKGGMNLSSFWGDGMTRFEERLVTSIAMLDPAMLISVSGGVFVSFNIMPDFLTIQPELLYMRTGKKWDAEVAAGTDIHLRLSTDYVQLPVIARLLIPLEGPLMPGAYIGPYAALKLRARSEGFADLPAGTNIGFAAAFGSNEDIGDFVNTFDAGMVTGIGFNIHIGTGDLIIDFRYAFGFLEVYDIEGASDIRNSVFTIFGGYAFKF